MTVQKLFQKPILFPLSDHERSGQSAPDLFRHRQKESCQCNERAEIYGQFCILLKDPASGKYRDL